MRRRAEEAAGGVGTAGAVTREAHRRPRRGCFLPSTVAVATAVNCHAMHRCLLERVRAPRSEGRRTRAHEGCAPEGPPWAQAPTRVAVRRVPPDRDRIKAGSARVAAHRHSAICVTYLRWPRDLPSSFSLRPSSEAPRPPAGARGRWWGRGRRKGTGGRGARYSRRGRGARRLSWDAACRSSVREAMGMTRARLESSGGCAGSRGVG